MQFSNYLTFNGNASEAIAFYEKAIGARVLFSQPFSNAPMPVSDAWKDKVLHATLEVEGYTLMVSDSMEHQPVSSGDNMHISLNFTSEEEIDRIFAALSEGGTVGMPLQDTFWGAKFGICKDRYGINWMFNYDRPGAQPEHS